MPMKKKTRATAALRKKKVATAAPDVSVDLQVEQALGWLKDKSSPRTRDEMGTRYGIHTTNALGVSVANMHVLAKRLRSGAPDHDHALAAALWDAEVYEMRMLATFVDDPALVTPAQMDRWARDFDNWGICDTACFHLFDRTPHAFRMVDKWAGKPQEFVKRAAFALLASLALHDKKAEDSQFLDRLTLIESAAPDDRNFVKKGVSWALRSMGRREAILSPALELAERLAASHDPAARWVGRDALKDLGKRTRR